jgi:ribose 1,5-bisphosphokinase PhnN
MSTLVKGFVRYEKWFEPTKRCRVFFGLSDPAPNVEDWRSVTWSEFPSEEHAREFVKRWNAHEALVGVLKEVLSDLDQGAMPNKGDEWFVRARAAIAMVK